MSQMLYNSTIGLFFDEKSKISIKEKAYIYFKNESDNIKGII
jgi:hypothetical protein